MKTLEINKTSQKNGDKLLNFSHMTYYLPKRIKLGIKVMPMHSYFLLWADMKIIYFV